MNETRSTNPTLHDKKIDGLVALLDCKRMNVRSLFGVIFIIPNL